VDKGKGIDFQQVTSNSKYFFNLTALLLFGCFGSLTYTFCFLPGKENPSNLGTTVDLFS
jgi:hypothetical protein